MDRPDEVSRAWTAGGRGDRDFLPFLELAKAVLDDSSTDESSSLKISDRNLLVLLVSVSDLRKGPGEGSS